MLARALIVQEMPSGLIRPAISRACLDATVKFNRLARNVTRRIADKFMNQIREQLNAQSQSVTYDDKALDYLAEHGYSETMGARPMKRLINEQIRLPIAKRIIRDGIIKHHITSDGAELVIVNENA